MKYKIADQKRKNVGHPMISNCGRNKVNTIPSSWSEIYNNFFSDIGRYYYFYIHYVNTAMQEGEKSTFFSKDEFC